MRKIALRLRGIIPADAGSTRKRVYLLTSRLDHPRGCGEHLYFLKLY